MMTEISLNILDVAQNSIKAGADLITIRVKADTGSDELSIMIEDNGCGMSREQLEKVTDPFFTSRTTRNVGLGVPFFKEAAELTGGSFDIESEEGKGTRVTAVFVLSSIDRMPLGDISQTIHDLIVYNTSIDFIYQYGYNDRSFTMDTREFKEILGDIPFDVPEVSSYILDFLNENKAETDGGAVY